MPTQNGQAAEPAYLIFKLKTPSRAEHGPHEGLDIKGIGDTMPAYIISDVTVRDAQAFQTYRTRAAASIAHYGGHYLVRGGPIEKLEGDWSPRAVVIVEFPDLEQARAWYRSPEYAHALEVRDQALGRNLILVDGVNPEG